MILSPQFISENVVWYRFSFKRPLKCERGIAGHALIKYLEIYQCVSLKLYLLCIDLLELNKFLPRYGTIKGIFLRQSKFTVHLQEKQYLTCNRFSKYYLSALYILMMLSNCSVWNIIFCTVLVKHALLFPTQMTM